MRLGRVVTVLVAMVVQSTLPAPALAEPVIGAGAFHMDDGRGRLAASMRVFYFRPDSFKPDGPIVIVIHGMGRTASRYRDNWEEASDRYGALILAPEFTRERYRGSRQFIMGNMINRDGSQNARSEWSFPVIDRVFLVAKKRFSARRSKFHLFGHSAGAQFVHRMALFAPSPHMDRAVAANAGWYTLPIQMERFPYGLGETSLSAAGLKKAFARRLTIMLGTDDNDPNHRSLRRTEEAMRQGPHRLARGHYFIKSATDAARRLGANFAWDLREIPGVAHKGNRMSAAAARYLFGNP